MNKRVKILAVEPPYAIPGGEIAIGCEGYEASHAAESRVTVDGQMCRVVAASSGRVIANLPRRQWN